MDATERFLLLKQRHLRDELTYCEISELIVMLDETNDALPSLAPLPWGDDMLDETNDALLSLAPLPWGDDKTRKESDAAHETKGRTK